MTIKVSRACWKEEKEEGKRRQPVSQSSAANHPASALYPVFTCRGKRQAEREKKQGILGGERTRWVCPYCNSFVPTQIKPVKKKNLLFFIDLFVIEATSSLLIDGCLHLICASPPRLVLLVYPVLPFNTMYMSMAPLKIKKKELTLS